MLKQCPKDLQSDICIHLNRKVLYSNPAFSSMPMSVLRTIARNFCICHVAPGDRVIHEGESLDVLYFISHGSFEVKQDGHVVGLLGKFITRRYFQQSSVFTCPTFQVKVMSLAMTFVTK